MVWRAFPLAIVIAGLGGMWCILSHDLVSAVTAGIVIIPTGIAVLYHFGRKPKNY